MPNKETLKQLLDKYLQHINKVESRHGLGYYTKKDEGYKFDFVSNFQKNFDLKAENLKEMLDKAIENNNLVVGSHFFPRKMLMIFAEEYESDVRRALDNLFNEKIDVFTRINEFKKDIEALMDRRNEKTGGTARSCIGLRFTSLLLASRYPEKYYAIKPAEYKRFIRRKDGGIQSFRGLSDGEKYRIHEKHADEVRVFIKDIPEIQKIHSLMTKDRDFKDPEFRWMTQDFMFIGGQKDLDQRIEGEDLERPKKTERSKESIRLKEIKTSEFLDSIKLDGYKYDPYELKPPNRIKIRPIIENCSCGKLVLPHFQRYFDWKKEDVRDFFESIFNGYYVGAFLFWDVEREPALGIMPIKGISIPQEEIEPNTIILDGQQRITSLYYAIKSPDFKLRGSRSPLYFYININTIFVPLARDKEAIVVLPDKLEEEESYRKLLFPLYELERYDEWVDGFEDFMLKESSDPNKARQIRRIIDKRLKHIWDGFEIPYITLPKDMELVQATEIFERLNTRGKPLSVFDLLIARMFKYEIKLRELWDETRKKYPNIKRYYNSSNKIPIYVLQAIALFFSKSNSCKRKDILDIYKNVYEGTDLSFEDHWREMSWYLNRAIEMLENLRGDGFGVKDEKEVPFMPTLPILAALLKEIDLNEKKADCYKKLKRWYWASVFFDAYSHTVDSRLTSDFKEMKLWFSDDSQIPKAMIDAKKMFTYIDLKGSQYQRGALYRGVMSLLAIEGARDFETGQLLENARSNDKDHIYPKAPFGFLGGIINSVLNMTWMSKKTNRKIKQHKKPSEYLKEFIEKRYAGDQERFLEVLKTHFINKNAFDFLLKDERGFDDFLEERERLILEKIQQLLEIESGEIEPGLITPDTPFKNKMMYGEAIKACNDYLYWADKYFSIEGLKLLSMFLRKEKVKNLKIITSSRNIDDNFRSLFKNFKAEMEKEGVDCELRVIVGSKLYSEIHDRFIFSKNKNFNLPSPDTMARGQYSERKETKNRWPCEEWWRKTVDIIRDWNKIKEAKEKYAKTNQKPNS